MHPDPEPAGCFSNPKRKMESTYDYGLWSIVAFNVLLFGGFAISFIRPSKKHEWRTMGVFLAFIVALFTEMYGFPLTIYALVSFFGSSLDWLDPFQHVNGHLLGTLLGLPYWGKLLICIIGGGVMVWGLSWLGKGWKRIHQAHGELVTDGIYGLMRHPQYSGLFLITVGMLIQWPTLLTLLMWPILMVAYYQLAMREEREVMEAFPLEYEQYRQRVPAFIPSSK